MLNRLFNELGVDDPSDRDEHEHLLRRLRPRLCWRPRRRRHLCPASPARRSADSFACSARCAASSGRHDGTWRPSPSLWRPMASFLERHGFDDHFIQHYALPVVACVWSTGGGSVRDYPAGVLVRIPCEPWLPESRVTPRSGTSSKAVRARMSMPCVSTSIDVRTGDPVTAITRKDDRVALLDAGGREHDFDRVVIATHADEALRLLTDASEAEFDVLGSFDYSVNTTQLHTDDTVLRTAGSEARQLELPARVVRRAGRRRPGQLLDESAPGSR